MLRFTLPALPLLAISLAACSTTEATPPLSSPPTTEDEASCGANKVTRYIGKTYSDEVLTTLKAESGAQTIRVLKPHSPMTMDYRPDRLNIHLNTAGVIEKLHCV